jgi:archaellum biogenesis ATPase FlaH
LRHTDSPAAVDACPPSVDAIVVRPLRDFRNKWKAFSSDELNARCAELDGGGSIIEGLIPKRSISLLVGDSGLGKSPLLYQAAMCVAAGIPFLGHPTQRGRVLFLDFENGVAGVNKLRLRLTEHVGQEPPEENLIFWNYNDAPSNWAPSQLAEMIKDLRPNWVIIDSLSAFAPEIEAKSANVTSTYQQFRRAIKEFNVAITAVHHLRKVPNTPGFTIPSLETDPKGWLQQARGARQIINGSDVRIGVDHAKGRSQGSTSQTDGHIEVAFVLAGFERLQGTIDPIYVGRVFDDNDEVLGYKPLEGSTLLFNPDQENAFRRLPEEFTNKQAKLVYGKGDQPTINFLRKCISAKLLSKTGRKYKKIDPESSAA